MDKYVTTDYWQQCIYFNTPSLHTCPNFCKQDLVPPDFNDNIAFLYSSSDLYVQSEDGLTRRGRNM